MPDWVWHQRPQRMGISEEHKGRWMLISACMCMALRPQPYRISIAHLLEPCALLLADSATRQPLHIAPPVRTLTAAWCWALSMMS